MHILLFYDVADDYAARREAFRNEHLALARAAQSRGDLVLGGALAEPLDGALLVFRGPSPEAAEAFAEADPYVKHGLVTAWRVRKWNTVIEPPAEPAEQLCIVPMTAEHWPLARAIYEEGIATGNATFELSAPEWEKWDSAHLREPRLVALADGDVVGWAALSPVSERCVYGGVTEVSIYVAERARGRGIGKLLLNRLVSESEARGIWMLQAGIFPENQASIKLHRAAGFRVVGTRERLGRMNGQWRNVVLLERRSPVAGA